MKSEFASPERALAAELQNDIEQIQDLTLVAELTQLIPDAFVILNIQRQIIYANSTLVDLLDISSPKEILGMRPGEALNCINARKLEGGCGTSNGCKYCGAVKAILSSQDGPGQVKQEECRLTAGKENHSFDFQIRAKTLSLLDRQFTLMMIQDISTEKRKTILERLFFHDILNTAGGIQGLVELMQDATEEEMSEYLSLAESSTETLVEEINAQKDILAAENGSLEPDPYQLNSLEILSSVLAVYKNHPMAEGKSIKISPTSVSTDFLGDPRLLTRVIGNMVKNGLEAEPRGQTITMGVEKGDKTIEFWVKNPCPMPEHVKAQIFQRSFSTKGSGRGIGTYSIRLLGEQYMKGKVSFSSSETQGTQFSLQLPLGI